MINRIFLFKTFMMAFFAIICVSASCANDTHKRQTNSERWSVEKVNAWYASRPWIVGCNYVPSTAINDVEFWQSETFDEKTIEKELALAREWGLNSVRVFLNYVVWEAEPESLKGTPKNYHF